ncbi:DUF6264 family protein [Microbacterium sp. KSW4-17]|uniref:DUF6264 family protein n=1 Tax=Microbacterium galbum TaxID=3075994 RepID=A0ABU3T996_9MICO|nr:DUF6264 family protein [Microbacterium sp. KSW4-17]MDU0367944.1 DUF6264 family protein [Microbacterium sp. KSW4-17]
MRVVAAPTRRPRASSPGLAGRGPRAAGGRDAARRSSRPGRARTLGFRRGIPMMALVTFSLPPESFRTLRPEPRGRAPRPWDVATTIVLLVLLPLLALAASYAGVVLASAARVCGAQACDAGLMNLGFWIAVIAPWVILVVGLVVAIIRLVRHRLAFWVPLVAILSMVAVWFIAAALVGAGLTAS